MRHSSDWGLINKQKADPLHPGTLSKLFLHPKVINQRDWQENPGLYSAPKARYIRQWLSHMSLLPYLPLCLGEEAMSGFWLDNETCSRVAEYLIIFVKLCSL